jgi:hypothetical protein
MSMLIVSVFLIGAALGVRFKVLILIPAIGLAFITILAGGIARSDSASAILIAFVLASICLQIGYFCGIVMQHRLTMARAGNPNKTALQAK